MQLVAPDTQEDVGMNTPLKQAPKDFRPAHKGYAGRRKIGFPCGPLEMTREEETRLVEFSKQVLKRLRGKTNPFL
jgi:hypothetical protein